MPPRRGGLGHGLAADGRRAVADGMIRDRLPFVRTAKGERRTGRKLPALWEGVSEGCWCSARHAVPHQEQQVHEISISARCFGQSLPFLAAVGWR